MKGILCYITLLFFTFLPVYAGLDASDNDVVVGTSKVSGPLSPLYDDWKDVVFSGKLSIKKLPVSPSVRIYMVRDSLIQISARVPLLGEVGRLSLTRDKLLIVNKHRKTYCEEDAGNLLELYPSAISDIQALLLARVVVFGQGELNPSLSESVEVQEMENGNFIILPHTEPGVVPFNYGYVVSPALRTLAALFNVAGKASLELRYGYKDRGLQIDALYDNMKGKRTEVDLDFSSVKWGGSELPPVKTGGYRKLGLKEFIKHL